MRLIFPASGKDLLNVTTTKIKVTKPTGAHARNGTRGTTAQAEKLKNTNSWVNSIDSNTALAANPVIFLKKQPDPAQREKDHHYNREGNPAAGRDAPPGARRQVGMTVAAGHHIDR